ncbi:MULTISPECIES: hypothetical protein [Calothrix]|uniref:Uncharacterized protein n=2 Tax=Calothrix TaxID=1186 RepID=A0ABR8AMU0_9CYAN|nr:MULTISPECIES: hypothetical protein [Calothrix]MBD2200588.1 hypothetical protein [Calothrix parietina FACHB-288]MBD2229626.1 hypothetical protein [Calothrix anomala FACHB-343]
MKISLNSQQSTVNAIFQLAIHTSFWHHQAGKSVFPMPNAQCPMPIFNLKNFFPS